MGYSIYMDLHSQSDLTNTIQPHFSYVLNLAVNLTQINLKFGSHHDAYDKNYTDVLDTDCIVPLLQKIWIYYQNTTNSWFDQILEQMFTVPLYLPQVNASFKWFETSQSGLHMSGIDSILLDHGLTFYNHHSRMIYWMNPWLLIQN